MKSQQKQAGQRVATIQTLKRQWLSVNVLNECCFINSN